MLKRNSFGSFTSIVFAILAMSAAASASASTMQCSAYNGNLASDVSNSLGCLVLQPLDGAVNDSVNPPPESYTVNTENFFGINTWSFDGRFDPNAGTEPTLATFNGGAQSGNYVINNPGITYSELMFVFKDGSNTNLVAYLINFAAGGGTYTTPFTDPPFDLSGASTSHDISHISVYYATDPGGPANSIPAPRTVALLGIGLLAAAVKSAKSGRF